MNLYSPRFAAGQNDVERRDPALFALQFALAELWRSWGIEPDAVLGAGVGEYAAAVIAGVMSCEDALKLVAERARILQLALHNGDRIRPLDEFEAAARSVKFQLPSVPFVSGFTGQILAEGEIPDAGYWRRHVQQGMQLEKGVAALAAKGYDHFLEVGPPGNLSKAAFRQRS